MTIQEVLKVSIDLAEGLNFIHPEIVHRDLKPDNVMLTCDGRARIIGEVPCGSTDEILNTPEFALTRMCVT